MRESDPLLFPLHLIRIKLIMDFHVHHETSSALLAAVVGHHDSLSTQVEHDRTKSMNVILIVFVMIVIVYESILVLVHRCTSVPG